MNIEYEATKIKNKTMAASMAAYLNNIVSLVSKQHEYSVRNCNDFRLMSMVDFSQTNSKIRLGEQHWCDETQNVYTGFG